MHDYSVLKPFHEHQKGDTVSLNKRQALHLELAGFIKLKKQPKKASGGTA